MKTIKVSIQDQNTLVLQEDAKKGDLIDLQSIHEQDIDKSSVNSIVKSIKLAEFNTQLAKEKENFIKSEQLKARLRGKDKEQEIATLKSKLDSIAKQTESEIRLKALEEQKKLEDTYREKLSNKDLEINEIKHKKEIEQEKLKEQIRAGEAALVSLKEMRTKMSTKMIGESLELHCENEFNKIRSIAFPNAEFAKDNQVSGGTKGDYIYREFDDDGNEILSIMFEMKNEDETTATKHKNKDFFKKLDKDRREKDCEYAVLVSLLEKDNEYYDDIVTVHEYPHMYSIRPQHFITTIGFLRQGNLKSQEYKRKIQVLKNQNIDVSNFERELGSWKDSWLITIKNAGKKHIEAIEQINKAIKDLEKVRDALTLSDKHLLTAENKIDSLTIRRLTADSPSVARAIEEQSDKTKA